MLTRRQALTGTAAAVTVAATPALAASGPACVDGNTTADIPALIAEYHEADHAFSRAVDRAERLYGVGKHTVDPACRIAEARFDEAWQRVCDSKARTRKDILAKLRLILDEDNLPDDMHGSWTTELMEKGPQNTRDQLWKSIILDLS